MIVTFYNEVVPKEVATCQKRVFNHFGYEIKQIMPDKWESHAGAIDDFIRSTPLNVITIFDIDCIPLNERIIQTATSWAKQNTGIFGAAQRASHISDSIIYASPAFMVLSKETYIELGSPSFRTTSRGDCAAELTYAAREKGIEVRLLYPSHVENEEWKLDGSIKFGQGTTYNNSIYHSFHARWDYQRFIDKCKSIIG